MLTLHLFALVASERHHITLRAIF